VENHSNEVIKINNKTDKIEKNLVNLNKITENNIKIIEVNYNI